MGCHSVSHLAPLLFFCPPTHNQSQSQRIFVKLMETIRLINRLPTGAFPHLNHVSQIHSLPPCSCFTGAMMLKERGQTAAEHVRHVSHFMTNYHKRGGLTVISAMTFQNARQWDGEVREKEGDRRVNGFLSVIHEEWASTWDLLLNKKKKTTTCDHCLQHNVT